MQLTKQRIKQLKTYLQKYPPLQPIHFYAIGKKQSSSGFFSNERILWINTKQCTINYMDIGKNEPFVDGVVPMGKNRIYIANQRFKYLRINQKQPAIRIWEEVNKENPKKQYLDWKFQFESEGVANEIIGIIGHICNSKNTTKNNQVISKEKPKQKQIEQQQEKEKQTAKQKQNATKQPSNIPKEPQSPIQTLTPLKNTNNEIPEQNEQKKIPPKVPPLNIKSAINSSQTNAKKQGNEMKNTNDNIKVSPSKLRNYLNNQDSIQESGVTENTSVYKLKLGQTYKSLINEDNIHEVANFNKKNKYEQANENSQGSDLKNQSKLKSSKDKSKLIREPSQHKYKQLKGLEGEISSIAFNEDPQQSNKFTTKSKPRQRDSPMKMSEKRISDSHRTNEMYQSDHIQKLRIPKNNEKESHYIDYRTQVLKSKQPLPNKNPNHESSGYVYSEESDEKFTENNRGKQTKTLGYQIQVLSQDIQEDSIRKSNNKDVGGIVNRLRKNSRSDVYDRKFRKMEQQLSEDSGLNEADSNRYKYEREDEVMELNERPQNIQRSKIESLKSNKSFIRIQENSIVRSEQSAQNPNNISSYSRTFLTPLHMLNRDQHLPRKNCHIDWNRIFHQSHQSLQVYQEFVSTCEQLIQQNIFGIECKYLFENGETISRTEQDGIIFTIYKHMWLHPQQDKRQPMRKKIIKNKYKTKYEYIFEESKPPAINFKQSTLRNMKTDTDMAEMGQLVYLYYRIHQQIENNKNIWKSNQYIIQSLLRNKTASENESNRKQVLVEKICPTLCCYIEYLGYHIYCEAELSKNYYEFIQKWETHPHIKHTLMQLQNLIHLQIPTNSLQVYQPKNNGVRGYYSGTKKEEYNGYIVRVINPIQLLSLKGDSIFSKYLNPLNISKHTSSIFSGKPSEEVIVSPNFSKSLQQLMYTELESTLCPLINTGIDQLNSSKIFSISGAEDYENLLEYFNITKADVTDFHILTHVPYWRKIIMSEICADVFVTLLYYSLHQEISMMYKHVKDVQKNTDNPPPKKEQNPKNDSKNKSFQQFPQQPQNSRSKNMTNGQINSPLDPPSFNSINFNQTSIIADIFELSKQMIYLWLDHLISYNHPSSQTLWKQVSQVVNHIYGIDCSNKNESTLPGYILDFVMRKLGIEINYKNKNYQNKREEGNDKKNIHQFPSTLNYAYIQSHVLSFLKIDQKSKPPSLKNSKSKQNELSKIQQQHQQYETIDFILKLSQYKSSCFNKYIKILETNILKQLIDCRQVSRYTACVVAGSNQIIELNNSINQSHFDSSADQLSTTKSHNMLDFISKLYTNLQLPSYLDYLQNYIKLYLAHKMNERDQTKYGNIFNVYDTKQLPILSQNLMIGLVPHSSIILQRYFHLLKEILQKYFNPNLEQSKKHQKNALYLFNCLIEQNVFWGGEFNPYILQLYTQMINFWIQIKDYSQAIKFYKSSMLILIKVYPNSVLIADKHAYLGEILSMAGKYTEAVKEIEEAIMKFQHLYRNQWGNESNQKYMSPNKLDTSGQMGNSRRAGNKSRIFLLKYVRCIIKRSKILLKIYKHNNTNNENYSSKSTSPPSKGLSLPIDNVNIIIDPLLSILNQIKTPNETSFYESASPNKDKNNAELSQYYYRYNRPCPPFMRNLGIKIQQIEGQIMEIFQIVYRCYIMTSKARQIANLLDQFIINSKLITVIYKNPQHFKRVLKIFLYYELKVNETSRKKQENDMIYLLIETLRDFLQSKKKQVSTKEDLSPESAYRYTCQQYFPNKQSRQKTRSPAGSNKKMQSFTSAQALFKRFRQYLRSISKIMNEIIRHKLFDKHTIFNPNSRSEAEQFLGMLQAIGLIVGYDFLMGLAYDITKHEYYSHVPGKTVTNKISGTSSSKAEDSYYENMKVSQVNRRL